MTGEILQFRAAPFPSQRARYASDHNKFFRYISAPDNNRISFQVETFLYLNFVLSSLSPQALQLRDRLQSGVSVIMRVTRTTIPYESVEICHPYPLWVNDPKAQVHQGSLLFDITKEVRNNEDVR